MTNIYPYWASVGNPSLLMQVTYVDKVTCPDRLVKIIIESSKMEILVGRYGRANWSIICTIVSESFWGRFEADLRMAHNHVSHLPPKVFAVWFRSIRELKDQLLLELL